MEERTFAIEINLNFSSQYLQHKTDFNDTQVHAYLAGLNTHYREVLIVCCAQHVLALARGNSATLLIHTFSSLMADVSMIKATETTKASEDLMLKVAKGERWREMDQNVIRLAVEVAITRAAESDCLGPYLQDLAERALNLNYLSARPHTWQDKRLMTLKYPIVADFDFDHYSLN